MIKNYLETYSDAQAITASAASTNVVTHGAAGNAIGNMEPVYLVVQIDTAFTGGTSVQFALQTDSAAAHSSPTTVWQSEAIAVATLVDKYIVGIIPLPIKPKLEAYSRVYYTVVGTPSAGKVTAFLTRNPQFNDVGE